MAVCALCAGCKVDIRLALGSMLAQATCDTVTGDGQVTPTTSEELPENGDNRADSAGRPVPTSRLL